MSHEVAVVSFNPRPRTWPGSKVNHRLPSATTLLSITRADAMASPRHFPERHVLIAGLIRNVGNDQLKHLVLDPHTSVRADDFSWGREGITRIVHGVVVNSDRRDRGSLRNLHQFRKRIKVLPAEIPLRNLHQRNLPAFWRFGESLERLPQQVHVRIHSQ